MSVLALSDNQLTGEIPPELGNLTGMWGLYLSDNQLNGEIPPELGSFHNMYELRLVGNNLTGCIPEELRHVQDNVLPSLGLPYCDAEGAPGPEHHTPR